MGEMHDPALADRKRRRRGGEGGGHGIGHNGLSGAEEATVLRILREAWQFSDEDVQRLLVLATRP